MPGGGCEVVTGGCDDVTGGWDEVIGGCDDVIGGCDAAFGDCDDGGGAPWTSVNARADRIGTTNMDSFVFINPPSFIRLFVSFLTIRSKIIRDAGRAASLF